MPEPNIPPVAGAPIEEEAEDSLIVLLQAAATADGAGTAALTDGYKGCLIVELQKTGTGTTTVIFEGSFDQVTWYSLGYQQTDAVAAPARAVAAVALGAGAVNHVYQILDDYPYLRARLSGTAGAISVQAKLYALPV